MGNSNTHDTKYSKSENGCLSMKIDKEYYHPGDMVQGKIYIKIDGKEPVQADYIEMEFKGTEKVSFERKEKE